MTACPPLAVYELAEGPVNAATWLVCFVRPSGRLPVVFTGATEADAVESAKAFWATESAKLERGNGPKQATEVQISALAKARAARAAKSGVQAGVIS